MNVKFSGDRENAINAVVLSLEKLAIHYTSNLFPLFLNI